MRRHAAGTVPRQLRFGRETQNQKEWVVQVYRQLKEQVNEHLNTHVTDVTDEIDIGKYRVNPDT